MSINYLRSKNLPIAGLFVLFVVLVLPIEVHADDPVPLPENGTCISCHEDLYYLHDTGKWFCLNESPMTCVDCHGGNPNTFDKDLAHSRRVAHPIINDDVTKCQQCHPAECDTRVKLFDQKAGTGKVIVAVPYTPSYSTDYIPMTGTQQKPNILLMLWEFLPLVLVVSLAIVIYLVARRRYI